MSHADPKRQGLNVRTCNKKEGNSLNIRQGVRV